MTFQTKSFTDIQSLTRDEINYILDKAAVMKKALLEKNTAVYRLADSKDFMAASLFYENSTRTRSSFEIAAKKLGMDSVGFVSPESTSVKKGESLKHTLDMFRALMCDVVILRHHLDGAAKYAADYLQIPVFNAGDGKNEHPTQTLLDLFTIKEHLGRLDNIDIGMGGDLKYGRTVHSLAIALTKYTNVRIHLFSHPLLKMPSSILHFLKKQDLIVVEHFTLQDALQDVDVFYQTRIQKERMPDEEEYNKAKDACRITEKLLEKTRKHLGILHPLPINKEYPEIVSDIDEHQKVIYREQARNGLPVRLVLLAISLNLLGEDFHGRPYPKPVPKKDFYTDCSIVKKEVKSDAALKPIKTNGTVIDHLQQGTAQKLMYLLKVEERGDIYRGGTVRRKSNPSQLKAMLMIENRTLTEDELRIVAAISPDCRVNTITNGEVSKKIQLSMPDIIEGISTLTCTNRGCITRQEHQEHVMPKFIRAGDSLLKCYYCNALMSGKELF